MKTNEYWNNRRILRYTSSEKRAKEYILKINKIYEQANRNIQEEIKNIYKNYSNDTGIDIQKLKEFLTKSETKKNFKILKKLGYNEYIKNNYKSRINRLEKLQLDLYKKVKEIYSKENIKQTELYKDITNNGYYKAIYDTQIGTGYDFNFSNIDDNMMDALLSERWHGKNYSERVWGNTDILANQINEIIGGALLSGQEYEKTAQQIRERFNVGKYYAKRLVRTETNYFNNQADAMAYEEMGINKYVFVATLDNRTSEICQSLDHEVYEYSNMEVGVNYPPMHVNCRSTTRGYLGKETEKMLKRRAKNPITGEYELISNMSYKEWYDKNVKKHGKEQIDISYKKIKYQTPDKRQYENYKSRLSNSPYLPKKFEEFTKLKYNNVNSYKQLTREYRTIGKTNKRSNDPIRDNKMYYQFRKDKIEMTDHAIEHYFDRMHDKKGNDNYTYSKIVEIVNKEVNYVDTTNNRNICYYDKIAIIKELNTNEIVSIRKGRLSKKWKEI